MIYSRSTLHLISQAHLDPVWLWPLQDGVAETLSTCQSAGTACDHPLDRMAEEFQIPPIAMPDSAHAGNSPRTFSSHDITPETVSVLAIKPGQRGGAWIIRLRKSTVRATTARITTQHHAIEIPLAPFDIASLRLDPNGKWDRVHVFENLAPSAQTLPIL